MAYVLKPKGENKEVFESILKDKAKKEGAIIALTQNDIAKASKGLITNSATISGIMGYYKQQGLIVQVERGNPKRPSKYDISAFLQAENIGDAPVVTPALEQVEVEIVQEEKPTEGVTLEVSASSLADISSTIKEMVAYYIESVQELKEPLTEMTQAIQSIERGEDPAPYQAEIASLKEQLEQSQARVEELENAPKKEFNAHLIYRSRNFILDEVERYFMMPGWQRKSKDAYLKIAINNHLTAIMKELGIEAAADLYSEV